MSTNDDGGNGRDHDDEDPDVLGFVEHHDDRPRAALGSDGWPIESGDPADEGRAAAPAEPQRRAVAGASPETVKELVRLINQARATARRAERCPLISRSCDEHKAAYDADDAAYTALLNAVFDLATPGHWAEIAGGAR